METSSNRNHLSTAEVPAAPQSPWDRTSTGHDRTPLGPAIPPVSVILKLSESSSRPTVIYLIDNSVCSLLCTPARPDSSELGLVTAGDENADLAWYSNI